MEPKKCENRLLFVGRNQDMNLVENHQNISESLKIIKIYVHAVIQIGVNQNHRHVPATQIQRRVNPSRFFSTAPTITDILTKKNKTC